MERHGPALRLVVERLKLGPQTAATIPEVKDLKGCIGRLRDRGWPIATEMRTYWDKYGVERVRAEYRLGNWTEMSLPFGGLSPSERKTIRIAGRLPSTPAEER